MGEGQKIWAEYGDWLVKVRISFIRRGYSKLLYFLHQVPFTWIIKKDENRASDGKALRYDYLKDMHLNNYSLNYFEDCSVLEMLVALAIRADSEWVGDIFEDRPDRFLWIMLSNLGLNNETNSKIDYQKVSKIIYVWLNREYTCQGKGGLFPLKHTNYDQRTIEIWDQLIEYINENYKIF